MAANATPPLFPHEGDSIFCGASQLRPKDGHHTGWACIQVQDGKAIHRKFGARRRQSIDEARWEALKEATRVAARQLAHEDERIEARIARAEATTEEAKRYVREATSRSFCKLRLKKTKIAMRDLASFGR